MTDGASPLSDYPAWLDSSITLSTDLPVGAGIARRLKVSILFESQFLSDNVWYTGILQSEASDNFRCTPTSR